MGDIILIILILGGVYAIIDVCVWIGTEGDVHTYGLIREAWNNAREGSKERRKDE